MDSETSDETSSDYSTESSDDDGMETAEIHGTKLQLPQGLCERRDIFEEIFSTDTWNSFSETNREHLQTFLPNFPENDDEEKNKTLRKLFNFDKFRFNSPLEKFHEDLKAGYYRPDIANMRKIIGKVERKEANYRYRRYRERLKIDVIESQKKLLNQIYNLPPGVEPKIDKFSGCNSVDYVIHRTKRRYYQVLASIQTKVDDNYCSPDENYPEGPPISLSRKQRRHLNTIKNTYSNETLFYSTMSKQNSLDLDKYITPLRNPFYITDDSYKSLLLNHKKRKLDNCDDSELITKGITISDIVNRTQLPYIKNLPPKHHHQHDNNKISSKKKIRKDYNNVQSPELFSKNSSTEIESDSDSIEITLNHKKMKIKSIVKKKIKELPKKIEPEQKIDVVLPEKGNSFNFGKITPVTLSDLEGIDMMNIPIDLDNSDIDIIGGLNNKPELMQETHSNYLSLIRDIICSTNEHRMSFQTLEDRLKSWQENPISPLNDWYSFNDNWVGLLRSAVNFLCGNSTEQPDDFVPYMEFKLSLDLYQWIGAGRDSDSLLAPLCQYWLEHKTDNKTMKDKDELDVEVSDRSQTPPPPRCPTNWTVRKATPDEIKEFREQERKRYDNPHKAFTYRCNGFESVVGPLKGIYNPSVGNTKARGHTMLNADRPNFVTILSLVRDATARLPNGEGTRADICELLKCSQYISSTAPDNVLQSVVSGALDRMHTQFDPCVKYDSKRKIWIYLHRNRTEEDFERIHQQYQGINKNKKATKKTNKVNKIKNDKPITKKIETNGDKMKIKTKSPQIVSPQHQHHQQPHQHHHHHHQQQQVTQITNVATSKTSIMLSNNLPQVETPPPVVVTTSQMKPIKDDNEAVVVQRVASPKQITKTKGLVKILSPNQGKSLIIPSTKAEPIKLNPQLVTQQLLQTIANKQQKQQTIQIIQQKAGSDKIDVVTTTTTNHSPQIIQSISPQQLQNIKNVTLVRNVNPSSMNVSLSDGGKIGTIQEHNIQIKTQTTLTPAQQQQIIQTIKQKILPQATVINPQQQIILKQKTLGQIKQNPQATSLLGPQQKLIGDGVKTGVATQNPVVAKVLTNAAGQVISVESLLAHQKQHGSLPQGTTVRVSGTKGGQANIIQLTGTSKQNPIAQFAMASQNNIIALTSQPKLVVASQTTSLTTPTSISTVTRPISRSTSNKTQTIAKFPPKVTQQLINAKIIDGQKIVQPKIFVGSQNPPVKLANSKNISLTKPVTLSVAANANTIRMVNTANLNLTHIGGKPVLLAGKGSTIQNLQGQNVILQPNTSGGGGGGGSLVLQNTVKNSTTNISQQLNAQNVVIGPQLKMQTPQVVFSTNMNATGSGSQQQQQQQSQQHSQGHIVLEGHPVRLQTSQATNTQRVVLASQGQGGQILAQQILLPAGFQGTAINIKALQGVKVIPIAQAHGQGRGVQSRQVFARVMSPSVVKTPQSNEKLADPTITSSDNN